MDIQKWLDETVQPEAPPETTKRKAPRKRSRSDSSLLGPRPPSPRPQQADSHGGTSEALHATLSNCSTGSRYARKPRRKTRPQLYEPGSHAPQTHKAKSNKTSRKKSKALPDMVQNFQAKNVSGDRLTLKPRELGLFNKGRTSTAVKGRGLPDLVFSEMKFLQKAKVQPEASPRPAVAKKKRRKDHAQAKEGEISAFFTSTRPAPIEKDETTLPEHASVLESKGRSCDQLPVINNTAPTVELTDKAPYLGFGSRGPRHGSTSYASWSESNHAPSTTPAHLLVETDIPHSQRDSGLHGERYKPKMDEEVDQSKRPAPPPARKQGNKHISERFRVSSLVPSHNRTSRSHSHPQCSSSPRRLNLVDRAARFQSTDTAWSPSSMPPSMAPYVSEYIHPRRSPRDAQPEATANCDEHPPVESQNCSQNSGYQSTDGELQTSSDLERVLQRCNKIFHERRQAATSRRQHTEWIDPSYSIHSARQQHMRDSDLPTRRVPTVRFMDPPHQHPVLPNFTGPSIYEQQGQCLQPPPHSHMEEHVYQCPFPVEHGYSDDDGDEGTHGEHNWGGLFEEQTSYGLEARLVIPSGKEDFSASIGTGHPAELRPENDVVAPGFWRPNRLY